MPENKGLIGLRPRDNETAKEFCAPPYDVITYGAKLQQVLSSRNNLIKVHLRPPEEGDDAYKNAKIALDKFKEEGYLIEDNEPGYYIYKQEWDGGERIGIICALEVSDYKEGKVIRHEKTFDNKVTDRFNLRKAIGYQIGNIFGVVEDKNQKLLNVLNDIASCKEALFEFATDFEGGSDMEGSVNKIYKVDENSEYGKMVHDSLLNEGVYIADGHHRYHTSLKLGQKFTMMYISPSGSAKIQPYDRVVGSVDEEKLSRLPENISKEFSVEKCNEFVVPEKHSFIFYLKDNMLKITPKQQLIEQVKDDPVQKIDASILQNKILFPHLGLSMENIKDHDYFNYFPGNSVGLARMRELVDSGKYQFAVSLAAVDFDELKAVADKGINDPEIVMPQKSTYFWPKLLSGFILYKLRLKG